MKVFPHASFESSCLRTKALTVTINKNYPDHRARVVPHASSELVTIFSSDTLHQETTDVSADGVDDVTEE